MSALVKHLFLSLVTDERLRKALCGILVGIFALLLMPTAAVAVILSGGVDVDEALVQQTAMEQLTEEQMRELQELEQVLELIATLMESEGYGDRTTEAQIIYIAGLSEQDMPDTPARLVSCFAPGQTDGQLIAAVNSTFGTTLIADEFTSLMELVRATFIDISGYTAPYSKNNLDLVQWAIHAEKSGWGYVWGTSGEVLSRSKLSSLIDTYPDEVGGYAVFIQNNWLGRRTADCSGLIRGYCWLDPDTREIIYGSNGIPALTADGMYQSSTEKDTIDTIPEIPGLAVWRKGHIGIYIGGGQVIEAKGTVYGVVQTNLSDGTWTHWLKVPYITYLETSEEESN